MAYQTRCSKGADDGVSSAAQMEPGRERIQSISPPTFQPTPSCFHSLTVLCRWEWNSGKWTGRRAGTEMIARKPVITDRVRAESTGPVSNMCTWCQDSCSFISGNSLGHVGVFLPELALIFCFHSHAPEPINSLFLHSFPGLSLIMWNGLYTAEKVIIQWTLLSEACYFAVQFLGEFSNTDYKLSSSCFVSSFSASCRKRMATFVHVGVFAERKMCR